jgi:hypothetical protein
MPKFNIPKKVYTPYPMGMSEGIIYEVEDIGDQDTPFGVKHKIIMKIESMVHKLVDESTGQPTTTPMTIWTRYNLSGHHNSALRQHREIILGRKLSEKDAHNFDTDELVGLRVQYVILHQEGNDGNTYARIDSILRHPDQTKGQMFNQPDPSQPQQTPGEPAQSTPQTPQGQGPADPDSLPF